MTGGFMLSKFSATHALPALLLLLAIMLCSQWPLPFVGRSLPLLPAYVMLYYWALFRPSVLPLWLVCLFALLHDVLYGLPIGVSLSQFALLLLACSWLRRRVMLSHYVAAWLLLAPMMLGLFLLLAYWQFWVSGLPMRDWMRAYDMAFFLSWLSYPLFAPLLNLCYRQLPPE